MEQRERIASYVGMTGLTLAVFGQVLLATVAFITALVIIYRS